MEFSSPRCEIVYFPSLWVFLNQYLLLLITDYKQKHIAKDCCQPAWWSWRLPRIYCGFWKNQIVRSGSVWNQLWLAQQPISHLRARASLDAMKGCNVDFGCWMVRVLCTSLVGFGMDNYSLRQRALMWYLLQIPYVWFFLILSRTTKHLTLWFPRGFHCKLKIHKFLRYSQCIVTWVIFGFLAK